MRKILETITQFREVSDEKGYVLTHSPLRSQGKRNVIHHPKCAYLKQCYILTRNLDSKLKRVGDQESFYYDTMDELKRHFEGAESCLNKMCKRRCKSQNVV